MTPFFFGTGERRLFGVYSAAGAASGRSRAVVLCPPWGQEQLRAHRSLRQLANMLNVAGCHALRFDYFGSGDSDGDMTQADLNGYAEDIETAIDELKDTSGATRVALVGLRLGGTLAARVAARRVADVDTVVLWDPIVDGRRYLDELLRTGEEQARILGRSSVRAAGLGGGYEVGGFPLTERLLADFATIDLGAQITSIPARCATVVTRNMALPGALAQHCDGGVRTLEVLDGPAAWINDEEMGAGAIPTQILQWIVRCLT